METPVWLITGASRGFGKAFAQAALDHGCRVAAGARKPEAVQAAFGESEQLLPVKLDVTNQSEIKEAVNQVIKEFGHIDVLVNNAGYGIFGSLE